MAAQSGSLIAWIIPAAAGLVGAIGGSLIGYWWSRRTLRTQTLHTFMDECPHGGESPGCRYEARVRDDNKRLQTATDCEKSDILRHSIENHRRTVSQYYSIMLRTLDDGILRPKDVFGYWSSGALHIIPKAIQPLGQDDDKGLQRLYQRALTYEKRKER